MAYLAWAGCGAVFQKFEPASAAWLARARATMTCKPNLIPSHRTDRQGKEAEKGGSALPVSPPPTSSAHLTDRRRPSRWALGRSRSVYRP